MESEPSGDEELPKEEEAVGSSDEDGDQDEATDRGHCVKSCIGGLLTIIVFYFVLYLVIAYFVNRPEEKLGRLNLFFIIEPN